MCSIYLQICHFGHILQKEKTPLQNIPCFASYEWRLFSTLNGDEQTLIQKRCFLDYVPMDAMICSKHADSLGSRYYDLYYQTCRYPNHRGSVTCKQDSLRKMGNSECRILYKKYHLFIPIGSMVSF